MFSTLLGRYVWVALAAVMSQAHAGAEGNVWERAGKIAGVKPALLYSIGVKESGMRINGHRQPYPLTVNSDCDGPRRFEDIDEAKRYVRSLVKKTGNVDIGAMQINWRHNGRAMVSDPGLLLETEINVIAASLLIRRLVEELGSEPLAVAAYHNRNRGVGFPYAIDVYKIFGRIVSKNR